MVVSDEERFSLTYISSSSVWQQIKLTKVVIPNRCFGNRKYYMSIHRKWLFHSKNFATAAVFG